MGLGTQIRLRRLFAHPSGRLFGIAVDHFIGYGEVRVGGDYSGEVPVIRFVPEEIAWAVRCGVETGVDVIKVGHSGELAAFAEIVASAPVPVVVAGGPRTETIREGLTFTADALRAGAVGAVVGRNIWGVEDMESVAAAYRAVIHDSANPEQALASVRPGGDT